MSDISIVRWFLGLTLEKDTFRYFSNSDKSIVLRYQRSYGRSALSLLSNNTNLQIMEHRFDNHLKTYTVCFYTGKYHWEIIKIPKSGEFVDYDDTSLILSHGRDIVNDSIIKGLNEHSLKIDLNTFKSIIESNPDE